MMVKYSFAIKLCSLRHLGCFSTFVAKIKMVIIPYQNYGCILMRVMKTHPSIATANSGQEWHPFSPTLKWGKMGARQAVHRLGLIHTFGINWCCRSRSTLTMELPYGSLQHTNSHQLPFPCIFSLLHHLRAFLKKISNCYIVPKCYSAIAILSFFFKVWKSPPVAQWGGGWNHGLSFARQGCFGGHQSIGSP